jgi:hypothetical protein
VIEVIALSDVEVGVACAAYTAIAKSSDPNGFTGLDGAADTRGLCKKQAPLFVDAIVARLGGDTVIALLSPKATDTLVTLLEGGFFDAAARARLRAAAAATPEHDRPRKYGALAMLLQ